MTIVIKNNNSVLFIQVENSSPRTTTYFFCFSPALSSRSAVSALTSVLRRSALPCSHGIGLTFSHDQQSAAQPDRLLLLLQAVNGLLLSPGVKIVLAQLQRHSNTGDANDGPCVSRVRIRTPSEAWRAASFAETNCRDILKSIESG